MYYSMPMCFIYLIEVRDNTYLAFMYITGNMIRFILDLGYMSRFIWSPQPISSHNMYRLSISPLAKQEIPFIRTQTF